MPPSMLHKFEPAALNIRRGWRMLCGLYPEGFVRRTPIFGVLSISAPLTGFVLAYGICSMTDFGGGDMRGFTALSYLVKLLSLAMLLGAISGLVGLSRGERWRALSFIGPLVNFSLILWLFVSGLLRTG